MEHVVNIAAYRFVAIADAAQVAQQVEALAQACALKGSILVAPEGINLFLAGDAVSIDRFLAQLGEDARFAGLHVKKSFSQHVPFRKLKVRVESEIITFDMQNPPPAPSVDAATLKRWLDAGVDDAGQPVVMLDTRNAEEVAMGTFAGALNPNIRKFTDFPHAVEQLRDQLQGKTVVAFCTGGVRCEKAVPWMQAHGLANTYQLQDGILGYFESQGGAHYKGSCFVFDERVAL
ncbi:MAG: sulfurtransferase, partial [Burkholderiaceae bacterium]